MAERRMEMVVRVSTDARQAAADLRAYADELERTGASGTEAADGLQEAAEAASQLGEAGRDINGLAGRISSAFSGVGSVVAKVAAGISAAVGAISGFAATKIFGEAIAEADAYAEEMKRIEGVIAATGGAAGLTAAQVDEMARASEASSSEFRLAAAQLLTFKSVSADVFGTTMGLAVDLAETGFGSVESAAVMMGKALENPAVGLSALGEAGVSFTEAQKELIKSLVSAGDLAQAQGIILDAVAGQVGGVAEAMGGTLSDATDAVSKRFGELKIQLGAAVTPVLAEVGSKIASLYERLRDSGAVAEFGDAIAGMAQRASSALIEFADSVDWPAWAQSVGSAITRAGQAISLLTSSVSAALAAGGLVIHSIAGTVATAASWIVSAAAKINLALSKVTFGDLSAAFASSAGELESIAQSLGASAEANFGKLADDLAAIEEKGKAAGSAFDALNQPVERFSTQAGRLAAAQRELVAAEEAWTQALDAASAGDQEAMRSLDGLRQAVVSARESVERLSTSEDANTSATKSAAAARRDLATQSGASSAAAIRAEAAQRGLTVALDSTAGAAGRAKQASGAAASALSAQTSATAKAASTQDTHSAALSKGAQMLAAFQSAQATEAAEIARANAIKAASWEQVNAAQITYSEWSTRSGAADAQRLASQQSLATAVGAQGEKVRALSLALAEANAKNAEFANGQDAFGAAELAKELEAAKAQAESLKTQLQALTGEAVTPEVDDSQIQNVKKEIDALDGVTTYSQHTAKSNVPAVLAEIQSLDGKNTSSTHTIYVKKVESNNTGGTVGLGAVLRHDGGSIFRRPAWSLVPGVGDTDSVPAGLPSGAFVLRKAATRYYGATLRGLNGGGLVNTLLTPGERWFPPATVRRHGTPFFERLNRLDIPRAELSASLSGTLARFNAGGSVGGSPADGAQDTVKVELSVGRTQVRMQSARDQAQSLVRALSELQRGR